MPIDDLKKSKTLARKSWLAITWIYTWWIPTLLLRKLGKMQSPQLQIAWREKVTLNFIILQLCGLLLFFVIGLGRIMCPAQNLKSQGEIDGLNTFKSPFVTIFGNYYKIDDVIQDHVFQKQYINQAAFKQLVLGRDLSAMFYPTAVWNEVCKGLPQPSKSWDNIKRETPKEAVLIWYPHQVSTSSTKPVNYLDKIKNLKRGNIARDAEWISVFLADAEKRLIVAYGNVYDISQYTDPLNDSKFLGPNLKKIFDAYGRQGIDVTAFFDQIKKIEGLEKWKSYRQCMDNLFYQGVIDTRLNEKCVASNYILLASTIILIAIIGFKFIAAFKFSNKHAPELHDRYCIVSIPCYTESRESLLKSFDSVAHTKYADHLKLMFIVCDGLVTGEGNAKTTPMIVMDILKINERDGETFAFRSLGEGSLQYNEARVYSGIYQCIGREISYLLVVKVGSLIETVKPGNRGKRDSQLIMMNLMSKVFFNEAMTPLELEVCRQMKARLGMDPKLFDFALMLDADTEVFPESINTLISCMVKDSEVIGLCGETLISNEMDSWVSMIQVYAHHMAKAFESMFGSVTCLPGCFCLYRLKDTSRDTPFLISKRVIVPYGENDLDTLHKKNLLQLGEDRYLTTLLLKGFPNYKLAFSPESKAKTSVPNEYSVFLSQRRRWINSTVHNLFELLLIREMCGCLFFSMRFVVFIDLFATLVQPASLIYVGYLIFYLSVEENSQFPLISVIMISAIYGLQFIIILFRKEWQHVGWMTIYIITMPFWSFFLPIYAFWNFDDFTWGDTRRIEGGDSIAMGESGQVFDPNSIKLQKWDEYEAEKIRALHPQFFMKLKEPRNPPPPSTCFFSAAPSVYSVKSLDKSGSIKRGLVNF